MEESAAGSDSDSQTKKGPQKTALGGAAPLLGRRRGEGGRPRGRTASATSHREALSPAVCGVGPSRGLELCGFSSRPTSETLERSRDDHVTGLHCSTSLPSVGFLRSAGLSPLGVVDTPLLQPHQFLGIVSNSRRKGEQRRPVSWVGARTEAERRKRETELGEDRRKNRHSFSGGSNYVQHRSRVISLPRNTALVPTASMSVESTVKQKQPNALSGQSRTLVPLVPKKLPHESGQKIRVEVKRSNNTIQSVEDQIHTTSGGEMLAGLPDLRPAASPNTQYSATAPQQLQKDKRNAVQRISIVSVGAAAAGGAGTGGRARQRQRLWRRQGSPERREARLSLGWTQSKPLVPLTGLPVYRDSTEKRTSGGFSKEVKTASTLGSGGGEAAVSRDCIVIDVQEYLANY